MSNRHARTPAEIYKMSQKCGKNTKCYAQMISSHSEMIPLPINMKKVRYHSLLTLTLTWWISETDLQMQCSSHTEITCCHCSTIVIVCYVPHQNSTFGDRSFAAAGPRTWNELPFNLSDTGLSLTTFNVHLKTYLFSIAFWHLWHLWFLCATYKCTYLLTYLLTYL